ncbi:MAG: SusC/RagA family TonB-linked outer membrane protein [Rikenellaceae bacterium]|nr:SusC/RagA family TonB-linked outer membrane protein [Rikenellaceae bacterium]
MKSSKNIFLILLLVILGFSVAQAQSSLQIKGKILDPFTNAPVEGAFVNAGISADYTTGEDGEFVIDVESLDGILNVWAPGYYIANVPILGKTYIEVVLISEDYLGYTDEIQVPMRGLVPTSETISTGYSIDGSEATYNMTRIEELLYAIPGLQVIDKSGMPGEGSYINMRGAKSVISNNMPLIVINGIPQVFDYNESPVISGYSRGLLNSLHAQDIKNITVLRGADAAMYGSMGSNGVIMIETDKANESEARVSYQGQFGINMVQQKMPLLDRDQYKTYISDIAKTTSMSMSSILSTFPFLQDGSDYVTWYLYNNNTDWQDEIYRAGFVHDHLVKISGSDAIARFDMSVGYNGNAGQVENTKMDKYYVRLNSDVNLHPKLVLTSNFTTSYTVSNLAESGIIPQTNPLLAAFKKSPLLSPYEKDVYGNSTPDYAVAGTTNNSVSNPLSVVNDIVAENKSYDIYGNLGLNYKINNYFNLTGVIGLNYFYSSEVLFVPGVTRKTIMPLQDGYANNTVRSGGLDIFNLYYSLYGKYDQTFNGKHTFRASFGVQAVVSEMEYDAGEGRNTSSDFYQTLGNTEEVGRRFFGYNENWNWLNFYVGTQYIYNHLAGVSVNLSADRSSSTGEDAQLYGVYPGFNGIVYLKNTPLLSNSLIVNKLNVFADYTITGNSQYPSNLSKYYYDGNRYQELTGIVRDGIPNTRLKPETNHTWSVGVETSLHNHRLTLKAEYYQSKVKDLILLREISAAFGSNYMYDNVGEIENKGFEIDARYAIINRKNVDWYVGLSVAQNKNKILSLSNNNNDIITELSDGAALINRVGYPLNSFYGLQTEGIYASTASAVEKGYSNYNGQAYSGGDVIFVDQNGDKVINNQDRVILGDAYPDIFGTIYTNVRYNNFNLYALFTYCLGNKAYNATRRSMEAGSDYSNQYRSVASHWTMENQVTDMPRVNYGDPLGNNRFSDRFIEDASYIKLKEVMLSYTFPSVIHGLTVYVAGENLYTFTKYLGIDPEFMYSYDTSMLGIDYAKVALARTIKFGIKLQF